jgi:hypothetical protein
LRYEFYNVFKERFNRDLPFDTQTCGGFCPYGSEFAFPNTHDFAPRISFAWAPAALHDRTVIRAGAGIYYGEAQLGDAYAAATNDILRFTQSQATTPGAYPIVLDPNSAVATAPRGTPRNKGDQVSQQWGLSVQQALTPNVTLQAGYNGQQNYHVFSRT